MNINEVLEGLLYLFITVMTPVVTTYIVKFLKVIFDEKLEKVNNAYVKNVLEDSTNLILEVIDVTNQTYVNSLKESGKFDKESQATALDITLKTVKGLLNEEAIEIISSQYNDLDTWIRAKIEFFINKSKVGD